MGVSVRLSNKKNKPAAGRDDERKARRNNEVENVFPYEKWGIFFSIAWTYSRKIVVCVSEFIRKFFMKRSEHTHMTWIIRCKMNPAKKLGLSLENCTGMNPGSFHPFVLDLSSLRPETHMTT